MICEKCEKIIESGYNDTDLCKSCYKNKDGYAYNKEDQNKKKWICLILRHRWAGVYSDICFCDRCHLTKTDEWRRL